MLARKLNRTELILVTTAASVLVLALAVPQHALVDIVAFAFELEPTSGIAVPLLALVMLVAVASVAVAYGINQENEAGQSGKLYDLNRSRRARYGRRRQRSLRQ